MRVIFGFPDDNDQKILSKAAETNDFDIVGTTGSGHQLYELIKEYSPNLIISDLCLYDYDLLHVYELLEKDGIRFPNTILLTSIRRSPVLQDFIKRTEPCVLHCFYRPVDPDVVVSRIQFLGQSVWLSMPSGNLEEKVCYVLLRMGVEYTHVGARELEYSVALCIEDPSRMTDMRNQVFPMVGERYSLSSYNNFVQSIGRVIDTINVREHADVFQELFPYNSLNSLMDLSARDFIAKLAMAFLERGVTS